MIPTVGRQVHYKWYTGDGGPLAATIVKVNQDGTVTLFVLDNGEGTIAFSGEFRYNVWLAPSLEEAGYGDAAWPARTP